MPRAPSFTPDPRPPRTTRKSYRPRASNRTMVGTRPSCCFAGFRTDRPRCEAAMKTAGRGSPNRYTTVCSESSARNGRPGHLLLNDRGWKPKNNPVVAGVFFLTSPSIEVVSMGRRNTISKSILRSLKAKYACGHRFKENSVLIRFN